MLVGHMLLGTAVGNVSLNFTETLRRRMVPAQRTPIQRTVPVAEELVGLGVVSPRTCLAIPEETHLQGWGPSR